MYVAIRLKATNKILGNFILLFRSEIVVALKMVKK
jgi:hypothetical protein